MPQWSHNVLTRQPPSLQKLPGLSGAWMQTLYIPGIYVTQGTYHLVTCLELWFVVAWLYRSVYSSFLALLSLRLCMATSYNILRTTWYHATTPPSVLPVPFFFFFKKNVFSPEIEEQWCVCCECFSPTHAACENNHTEKRNASVTSFSYTLRFLRCHPLPCLSWRGSVRLPRSRRWETGDAKMLLEFSGVSFHPRWTRSGSGSPRMLLVLVREFESRRGEILNVFAKINKKRINCWERLAWVSTIRRESTREDRAEIFSR